MKSVYQKLLEETKHMVSYRYPDVPPSTAWCRIRAKRALNDFGYEFKKDEVVHHIDKDYRNYKITNLIVFKNQKQHMNWHQKINFVKRTLKLVKEILTT